MKKTFQILIIVLAMVGCKQEPTLQKYFVKNTESPNFISVDVPNSFFNTEKMTLAPSELEVLQSFKKMNILTYKTDSSKMEAYQKEVSEVKTILKDTTYQELIKVGSGTSNAAVYFVGETETIDEFVLFAANKQNGFAVVRVLGNDMNPTSILKMVELLQKSSFDSKQLEPLKDLFQERK